VPKIRYLLFALHFFEGAGTSTDVGMMFSTAARHAASNFENDHRTTSERKGQNRTNNTG